MSSARLYRGDRGKLRPIIGMSIAGLWHVFRIVKQPRGLVPRHRVAFRRLHSGKGRPPLFADLGQRIALIPGLPSPSHRGGWRADKAHGPDCSGRMSGLRRTMGVKRHAPRLVARQRGIFGLRLSQRSGHARSSLSLEGFSRGRPWAGLRSCLPAGAAPGPRLANASGRRPSTLDRDELHIG